MTHSKVETGHAKNVASLEELIAYCIGFGNKYQPSKDRIQIPNLQQQLADARAHLDAVRDKFVAYNTVRLARKAAFKNLETFSTRILNAFIVSDASDELIANVRSVVRKIQGIRISKLLNDTNQNTDVITTKRENNADSSTFDSENGNTTENNSKKKRKNNSAAQTSFDQLIEHVSKLIAFLQTELTYQPNEKELQVQSLITRLNIMRTTNSSVLQYYAEWDYAMLLRDEFFYQDKTGLCDTAKDVKNYVKSVYGATDPSYRLVSKIPFKKRRK